MSKLLLHQPNLAFIRNVRALSPVAYWPLSTDATEIINGFTSTVNGSVSFGVNAGIGDGNKAATFDGSDVTSAIAIGSDALFNALNLDEYTIMTWFQFATAQTKADTLEHRIFHIQTDNTGLHKLGHTWTGTKWDAFRREGGVTNGIDVNMAIDGDILWHCIFTQCSVSGGYFKVYNGSSLKLNTTSPAPVGWTTAKTTDVFCAIGNSRNDQSAGQGFSGNIAHVAWFNSILSEQTLADIVGLFI